VANLTGQYDVATELSVGLLNCVVAAIHENDNDEYPTIAHSIRLHIADVPRGAGDPVPAAERTGVRADAEVQVSTPTISIPLEGLAGQVLSSSRAAVKTAIGPAREAIGPIGPGIHPTCWPRITCRLNVRAWLRNTEALPAFVHGDLYLTTGIVRTDIPGPKTFLGLDQSSGPDVRFEPAAGTTVTDEQRTVITRIVRNFIRGENEPVTFKVDLPSQVHHFDFKLNAEGARQSATLMFVLGNQPAPGPSSASMRFLPAGADFAVGIGRDFLLATLRRQLLAGLPAEYTASGTGYFVRIRPDWASATFALEPGRIAFSLSGSGSIKYGWGPASTTDHFSFDVRQSFTLGVVGGVLKPALVGDPVVDLHDVAVFEGTIREKARENIKRELQRVLNSPPQQLVDALDVGRPLKDMLAALHPAEAGVALTGAQIRADGVVVPGTVALAPSRPVEVKRAPAGAFSDALESWIPGGTIERFVWGAHVEQHRFVTNDPITVTAARQCLRVEGTRVTHGGGLAAVSAEVCPLAVATLPVVPLPPRPPRGRPLVALLGSGADGGADVVGHYDPWASGIAPPEGPVNLLVHFADGSWEKAAAVIDKALGARSPACVVVGVVGRDELRRAAGVSLEHATLLVTDDPSGAWRPAFGVAKAPATVLVGTHGAVHWKDDGPLDLKRLTSALAKNLEPGGRLSWRALQATVAPSDPAPNVTLRLGGGRELPLRRLKGAPVALCFWTSSSEASIEQLRQLREALESREPGDRPYVVGIGDGEDERSVSEFAKLEQLPFPVLADPQRTIARRYGVSAWPTTVQVGPGGRVLATDLGLVAGINPCDVRLPVAIG
jgi:peroxiredoxin